MHMKDPLAEPNVIQLHCCCLMEMDLNKKPSLWRGLSPANHYGVDTGVSVSEEH